MSRILTKMESKLLIKRLSNDAIVPERSGSSASVGYDLYSIVDVEIPPLARGIVSTGIAATVPTGCYGRIAPRSGLAVKNGIQTGAGVIDPDYTGEVKVVLFNHDKTAFVIKPGYRVAQLVLERFETPEIEEVQNLTETERGEGGFGSTGQ